MTSNLAEELIGPMIEELSKRTPPDHLKFGRIFPFTKDPNFPTWVTDTFQIIEDQIAEDKTRYGSDWVSVGLQGLVHGIQRKSSRLFDLMMLGLPGKDKIEDEFRDNLMLAFYAYVYFNQLEENNLEGEDHPTLEMLKQEREAKLGS